jgi:hypothetical protein
VDEAVGVTFDVFLAQPNDIRDFPRLEAIFRLALGGPLGTERDAIHFENINYNFTTGDLTFDESSSDLIVRARVVDDTTITGSITSALTGISGALILRYADSISSGEPCEPGEPCDPPDDPRSRIPVAGFLPSLAGVYEGGCEGRRARLEIVTARLPDGGAASSDLFKDFSLQARLGLQGTGQCAGGEGYCVARSWESGQLDFYQARLTLTASHAADGCAYGRTGGLVCDVRLGQRTSRCTLEPVGRAPRNVAPRVSPFRLSVPSADRAALPPAGAELEPLRARLEGLFSGYVFHERSARFQPLRLASVATISTDNPHNEPNVYVSGTLQTYLGDSFRAAFAGFRIDRRTFFPARGMTLRSETSDLMLVIESWRSGYLSGTAYSRSQGRIGPVELRRGEEPPAFPADAALQPDPVGGFLGQRPGRGHPWRFELRLSPSGGIMDGLQRLSGSAQVVAPGLPFPRFTVAQGALDLFSGQVALLVRESEISERLVVGEFESNDELRLWIPSSAAWGTQMSETRGARHVRQ